MKKRYDEIELLSAYIDGELSHEEEKALEEKIALSKELKEKLAGLKKLKQLTQKAYKPIPESPYFETRLMAEINSSNPVFVKLKKYSPIIGAVFASLLLMIILRYNPGLIDKIVEEQADNLVGYYKENLQPLLFAANISNEDVFNFALNRRLPLDEEKNHYLLLGSEQEGSEYFEIKPASQIVYEDDYNTFVKALKLNQKQKLQMDSILESYAQELETQVLSNDKNTLAINSNIWNYSKAIVADLMLFAKDANEKEFVKIIPGGYNFNDNRSVVRVVNRVRALPDDNYIFFTPDTIFKENIDKKKLKDDLREIKKQLEEELLKAKEDRLKTLDEMRKTHELNFKVFIDKKRSSKKSGRTDSQNFKIMVDSLVCRVEIPNFEMPEFALPDMEEIEKEIEEATKHLRDFSISFGDNEGKSGFKFKIDSGDSNRTFVVPMPNIDSIIKSQSYNLDSAFNKMKGFDFYINPDSSLTKFKLFSGDSLLFDMNFDFRMQMDSLQENMKEFQKEMQELKKELQKENFERDLKKKTIKKKTDKGIEI